VVLCGGVSRLFYLSIFTRYNPYEARKAVISQRQDIIDRNGVILATNLVTYSLYARPSIITNRQGLVDQLVKFFPDIAEKNVMDRLVADDVHGRILIRRDITPKQKLIINGWGFLGLYFHEDKKRIYPHNSLLSHILGYVDSDENGLAGVEKFHDKTLRKSDEPLQLSIDVRVQAVMREALHSKIKQFNAKGGAAIIMDVNNAEIIAMVSLPDFNPYEPEISLVDRNYNNKTSFGLYEMGSTFKTFTMAMALENKVITLDDMFDVSKPLRVAGYVVNDYSKINEPIDARTVYVKSSNIGTAQIALKAGDILQKEFLQELEFFKPLSLEITEKSLPKMPRRWGLSRSVTASYGYGVSITGVHLAQATAAMINGGDFRQATLVKRVDGEVITAKRVISEDTSAKIREIMHSTVQKGTGRRANARGYMVGGKTGSANKIGKYGYDEDRLLSSFIGAFPMDNPKYLVFVMVDEPIGNEASHFYATGGVVAAPVVREIVRRAAPMLKILPK
jgi:cell division protein FtsI (penicillin-binding protein 3)